MNELINGKIYDTKTATFLAENIGGFLSGDFDEHDALFVTKERDYFVIREIGTRYKHEIDGDIYIELKNDPGKPTDIIVPLSREEAIQWVRDNLEVDSSHEDFNYFFPDAVKISDITSGERKNEKRYHSK